MTIPPDYFELREAAEAVVAAADSRTAADRAADIQGFVAASRRLNARIEALRKALAAGDERNGIEIVAGDKAWPHRQAQRNIGHIALALDGGMKETT